LRGVPPEQQALVLRKEWARLSGASAGYLARANDLRAANRQDPKIQGWLGLIRGTDDELKQSGGLPRAGSLNDRALRILTELAHQSDEARATGGKWQLRDIQDPRRFDPETGRVNEHSPLTPTVTVIGGLSNGNDLEIRERPRREWRERIVRGEVSLPPRAETAEDERHFQWVFDASTDFYQQVLLPASRRKYGNARSAYPSLEGGEPAEAYADPVLQALWDRFPEWLNGRAKNSLGEKDLRAARAVASYARLQRPYEFKRQVGVITDGLITAGSAAPGGRGATMVSRLATKLPGPVKDLAAKPTVQVLNRIAGPAKLVKHYAEGAAVQAGSDRVINSELSTDEVLARAHRAGKGSAFAGGSIAGVGELGRSAGNLLKGNRSTKGFHPPLPYAAPGGASSTGRAEAGELAVGAVNRSARTNSRPPSGGMPLLGIQIIKPGGKVDHSLQKAYTDIASRDPKFKRTLERYNRVAERMPRLLKSARSVDDVIAALENDTTFARIGNLQAAIFPAGEHKGPKKFWLQASPDKFYGQPTARHELLHLAAALNGQNNNVAHELVVQALTTPEVIPAFTIALGTGIVLVYKGSEFIVYKISDSLEGAKK